MLISPISYLEEIYVFCGSHILTYLYKYLLAICIIFINLPIIYRPNPIHQPWARIRTSSRRTYWTSVLMVSVTTFKVMLKSLLSFCVSMGSYFSSPYFHHCSVGRKKNQMVEKGSISQPWHALHSIFGWPFWLSTRSTVSAFWPITGLAKLSLSPQIQVVCNRHNNSRPTAHWFQRQIPPYQRFKLCLKTPEKTHPPGRPGQPMPFCRQQPPHPPSLAFWPQDHQYVCIS